MGLVILAPVGIFVATIHYCLVAVELGVVREDIRRLAAADIRGLAEDIRRLAEQIRDSERRRHDRP